MSKLITCQTVMSDPFVLVFRCRHRCHWGRAPGGGFWATPSPWVATWRRPLDVRWGPELRNIWIGICFVILGCMAFVGPFPFGECKLKLNLLLLSWNLELKHLVMLCYISPSVCLCPLSYLTYASWNHLINIDKLWLRLLAHFRKPLFL